jgi:hypothetical protein
MDIYSITTKTETRRRELGVVLNSLTSKWGATIDFAHFAGGRYGWPDDDPLFGKEAAAAAR